LRLDLGDHLSRVLTGRRPAFLGDLAALAEVRENGALAAAGERLAAGNLARPAAPHLALAVVNLVTIFVSLLLAFRHVERTLDDEWLSSRALGGEICCRNRLFLREKKTSPIDGGIAAMPAGGGRGFAHAAPVLPTLPAPL